MARSELYSYPTEHVWALLKHRIESRDTHPTTLDALFNELNVIWNSLRDECFSSLISSMPRRTYNLLKLVAAQPSIN